MAVESFQKEGEDNWERRKRERGGEKKIEAIQIPRGLTGVVRMEKHKQDAGKTLRMIKEISNYPLLFLSSDENVFKTGQIF